MEQDLVGGKLGTVGSFDLALSGGKLTFLIAVEPTAGVSSSLSLGVDASVLLDRLAALIPGTIDDAVISVIKAALLSK